MDKLQSQIDFLQEIEKLKLVCRANKTLGGKRFENAAEHSWHVALMAVVLQEYAESSVDLLRVVEMLLVHDLVEIEAGDTWLYSNNQSSKQARENTAAEKLFGLLPESQYQKFSELWREFEARITPEAKFASSMDGIQPLLNHLITGDPADAVIPAEKVRAKKDFIKNFAPRLWGLVENLIEKSIERGLYREGK